MKTFKQFINEAAGMIDISIKALDKHIGDNRNSETKTREFITSDYRVEEKLDGIKITVVLVDHTGDPRNDFIIAYKNQIQYDGTYDFATTDDIKKSSIANAQMKIVLDHFNSLSLSDYKSIPVNTELFVEFLMNKPTLSSNYTHKHGLVLLASSPTTYTVKMGVLKTSSKGFDSSNRDYYAGLLNLDVPATVFVGVFGSESNFSKGIISPELKTIFNKVKKDIDWSNIVSIKEGVKQVFLELNSVYGGTPEGFVFIPKAGGAILKVQKSGQVDPKARAEIKARYQEVSPELEQQYWNNVRTAALGIIQDVAPQGVAEKHFKRTLKTAAKALKSLKLNFSHDKRNDVMVKDDVMGNIQMILQKNIVGNNGALFLGKFRVLSKMHYKIIADGIKKFDNMTVCLVTSKDTKFSRDLRMKMLKSAFGSKIEIVEHSTGNLFSIMQKASNNINVVLAGSDRVSEYRKLLVKNPDMTVEEIARQDVDISASKLIANIDDERYFKANTPKEIHKLYKEIKNEYELHQS